MTKIIIDEKDGQPLIVLDDKPKKLIIEYYPSLYDFMFFNTTNTHIKDFMKLYGLEYDDY